MPSKEAHLKIARRNQVTIEYLLQGDEHLPWVVTVAFYKAIDAFRWINRAEDGIRPAACAGLIEYTPRLEETIESLYRAWLAACEVTEKLLARQVDAVEFREVASLAREKLNSMAWVRKSRKFRNQPTCDASQN